MAMLRRNTSKAREERIRSEARRKEYEQFDLMKLISKDRTWKANLTSDERVENKRYVDL